jgi:hypothetical protein
MGGGQEFVDGGEGGDVVEGGEVVAAGGVGFDQGGQMDEVGVGLFELAIDAQVVAPEGAGTDDGYAERWHEGYFLAGVSR